MASENRTVWHLVALVATLALSAVVAIVAVTRGERGGEPAAVETPTPTATASASASPGGLSGEGPYVVFARENTVFAYDVATGTPTELGRVEGSVAAEGTRQPGSGHVLAFATAEGGVWRVTRQGLRRVTTVPRVGDGGLIGSAVSLDDRRVALAAGSSDPRVVVVDLQSGRPTVVERSTRSEYPLETLLPVAWSLGGSLVYGMPYCECDDWSPGLFALDLASRRSTRLQGTSSTRFFTFAVAQSGQALYYGVGTARRCRSDESQPCERAPYLLRRLAAGERGPETIRRATDHPFFVDAISPDGRMLLVRRPISEQVGARLELYSAEGERQPAIRGIPQGGGGLAILPDDTYLIGTSTADLARFVLVRDGRAATLVEAPPDETLTYLGWLR